MTSNFITVVGANQWDLEQKYIDQELCSGKKMQKFVQHLLYDVAC